MKPPRTVGEIDVFALVDGVQTTVGKAAVELLSYRKTTLHIRFNRGYEELAFQSNAKITFEPFNLRTMVEGAGIRWSDL